jgi:hypothetical protein
MVSHGVAQLKQHDAFALIRASKIVRGLRQALTEDDRSPTLRQPPSPAARGSSFPQHRGSGSTSDSDIYLAATVGAALRFRSTKKYLRRKPSSRPCSRPRQRRHLRVGCALFRLNMNELVCRRAMRAAEGSYIGHGHRTFEDKRRGRARGAASNTQLEETVPSPFP